MRSRLIVGLFASLCGVALACECDPGDAGVAYEGVDAGDCIVGIGHAMDRRFARPSNLDCWDQFTQSCNAYTCCSGGEVAYWACLRAYDSQCDTIYRCVSACCDSEPTIVEIDDPDECGFIQVFSDC